MKASTWQMIIALLLIISISAALNQTNEPELNAVKAQKLTAP